MEKGLVTYVIQSNRKVFRPVPPEKLIENIKEKERAAQELLPELKRIHKTSKEAESNIHKGRKGIKTILQDILKCKNYVAFGSKGNFLEIMKHDFEAFQKRKKELKIEAKVILGSSARKTESTRLAYTKFRFIPEGFAAPTTTFVYGNKIAVIIWSEIPVATVIKSKDVAKSYKSHFEILWDVAKK